jgi:hypothetical protein
MDVLQFFIAATAPVVGFAGVAAGAVLQARHNRALALRSHRQDVYIQFVETTHAIDLLVSELAQAIETKKLPSSEWLERFEKVRDNMLRLGRQIDVIGSARAIRCANRVSYSSGLFASAPIVFIVGESASGSWEELVRQLRKSINEFIVAASVDLGVRISRRKRTAALVEMNEFELGYDQRMRTNMDIIAQFIRSESPDRTPDDGGS